MPADPHDWNELGNYLLIHERRVQAFVDEGFILSNGLEESIYRDRFGHPRAVKISGRLECDHGLFLDVDKDLEVMVRDGRFWVRIIGCKYHAGVVGDANRCVFRYDTSHPYDDHDDEYHKHRFDYVTWEEIGIPIWIGRPNWPHLSDVLDELQAWWETTGRFLHL